MRHKKDRPIDPRRASRLRHYDFHRSIVGEAMLRAALRALAATDAAVTVNEVLENKFSLTDVRLDLREVGKSIETTLRSEVAFILTRRSVLPRAAQNKLVDRFVAGLLPTRDNVMLPNPVKSNEPLRVPDLERLIAREMRRSGKQ